MTEYRAALPFVLGVIFQVGFAIGAYIMKRDARIEFRREQDGDIKFIRLLDAAQSFPALVAVAVAGFEIPHMPTAGHTAISGASVVLAFGCYAFVRSRGDNAYDALTHFGLSWLNQILILINVALIVVAAALTLTHPSGAEI